ncbi:hypothetical protein RCCWILLIS_85 [Rhodobacter phage RcCWillis]|nr:hypothetical protein RCCWILLIS_85 [Rhodobacter phage RcCWillis]
MPQFILNTPPTRSDVQRAVAYGYAKPAKRRAVHAYNDLDEFAQGYVEAMFFTNGDTGDENEDRLNEMGVARLTRESVARIAADCANFQAANAAALEAAKALVPGGEGLEHGKDELTDQRLGNLFWYARQGHGVTFEDDGYAECLTALQEAAQAFGESYVEAWGGWIRVR